MTKLIPLILAALLLAAPAYAQTPVERHGALSVKDGQVVDAAMQPVVLRGMSLFWSQWDAKYYNPEVVRWLKTDWNVDVVRVAVAVDNDGYLSAPEREMAKAETVIDAAIQEGLYVIVDWHAHEPHAAEAAAFFERIAKKYGAYPNLIYETYNEPLQHHGWAEVVRPYHMQVAAAIRAVDPDNLIVAGTPSWSQAVDVAAADPLPFSNLAYTLHFYAGTHRQWLRDKAQAALDRGAALFVTEWGTSEANGDGVLDAEETRLWWEFLETRKLSYVNWALTDKAETSAALRPGAAARGGWTDEELSPSGRLVREHTRSRADQQD